MPPPPGDVSSLETLAAQAYLGFLEAECASYVALTNLDSPVWNPVREHLLEALKDHLDNSLSKQVGNSSRSGHLRGRMFQLVTGGQYPSAQNRNAYANEHSRPFNEADDDEEEEQLGTELEQVKYFGRRCCSPCCTGGFVVEAMLAVVCNADVAELVFRPDLKGKIYRKKAVGPFLFFDVNSLLVHYMRRLVRLRRRESPALRRLVFHSGLLGNVDSQLVHEGVLKSSVELRRYYDFPKRFTGRRAVRAGTDFLMATLSTLFNRRENFFEHLAEIALTNECVNTRMSVYGSRLGGHAAVEIMAGIARSCPRLKVLNLSDVSSLSPECLVYLFYKVLQQRYTYS